MTAAALQAVDRRLEAIHTTLDHMRANLSELDSDVTRKTLDASTTVRGATASARDEARRAMDRLWQGQVALDTVRAELTRLRGTRPSVARATLEQIRSILDGPSVAVPDQASAHGRRSITEPADPVVRRTIDEVVAQMGDDFDRTASCVARVYQVWGTVLPELDSLAAELDGTRSTRLPGAGSSDDDDVVLARALLADYRSLAVDDPLGVPEDAPAAVRLAIEGAGARARASAAVALELRTSIETLRADLDACISLVAAIEVAEADGGRTVLPRSADIAATRAVSAEIGELGQMLEALGPLSRSRPSDARLRAEEVAGRLAALAERAGRIRDREAGGIADRDELRGRLEALEAKARAQGRSEDRELDGIRRRAADALFTAPCDLEGAERLVEEYQRSLRPDTGVRR